MLFFLIAPLLALSWTQSPAPAPAPVTAESFIPVDSMFVLRFRSPDAFAQGAETFVPADVPMPDPLVLLEQATSADARWDLIDRTKSIVVAGAMNAASPDPRLTIVASSTDAAAFAAHEPLTRGGWMCTVTGDVVVLSRSKPGPTMSADASMRAGLERHDFVARLDMEAVMQEFGEMVQQGLDEAAAEAESDSGGGPVPSIAPMFRGILDALDSMEMLEVHLSQSKDESRFGLEMTVVPGSTLDGIGKVDRSGLAEAARALDGDAALACLTAFDYGAYFDSFRWFLDLSMAQVSPETQAKAEGLMSALRELYAGLGPTMSMSMDVGAGGFRCAALTRPKDPATHVQRLIALFRDVIPQLPITGPETKTVDGLTIASYFVDLDLDAVAGIGLDEVALGETDTEDAHGFLRKIFGPKGLEVSTAVHGGALLVGCGSSPDLPRVAKRMSGKTLSAGSASMLTAMGTMNPGLVYKLDLGRLIGGIGDLAGAILDEKGKLEELAVMRELPPILMVAGIDGRVWKLHVSTDGRRLVETFRKIEALESESESDARTVAQYDIDRIDEALRELASENDGAYPETLEALTRPDAEGHVHLNVIPIDPWGRRYHYAPPSELDAEPYVFTLGADGRPGGEGDDADLDNLSSDDER